MAGGHVAVKNPQTMMGAVGSAHKFFDGLLLKLSVAAAAVGVIPGVNLGTVPVQGALAAARVGVNQLAGDEAGVKRATIEGTAVTAAAAIPGGSMAAIMARGAINGAGQLASSQVDEVPTAPAALPEKIILAGEAAKKNTRQA